MDAAFERTRMCLQRVLATSDHSCLGVYDGWHTTWSPFQLVP